MTGKVKMKMDSSPPPQQLKHPSFTNTPVSTASKGNSSETSQAKPMSTRAKLLKQKRAEETRRREEANQQKITDWLKWSAQREDDRKKERSQLLAMKRRKEEAAIDPSLLSPIYGIDFTPSAVAQKILGQNPASPVLQPPARIPDEPLPFPTLASSLKEEVLKKAPKKLFSKQRPPFPATSKPLKKTIDFDLATAKSPSKEKASSHMVLSSSCEEEGSTADIGLLQIEKQDDGHSQ